MARRPKNVTPPFQVGDVVRARKNVSGEYPDELKTAPTGSRNPGNIILIIRKVSYVGPRNCQSGWLVTASDGRERFSLHDYDSDWFRKV